jgi:hypothetical protein
MALFEVLIPGAGENFSAIVPSAAARGKFWSIDTATATVDGAPTLKLAAVTDREICGFNGREVTTTGLRTDAQILYSEGFEGYDAVAKECSLSPMPELVAVEDDASSTYVHATNPMTAVNDKVAFKDGKFHIAQSTEIAHYIVVGVETGIEDTTKSRFILRKLNGAYAAA